MRATIAATAPHARRRRLAAVSCAALALFGSVLAVGGSAGAQQGTSLLPFIQGLNFVDAAGVALRPDLSQADRMVVDTQLRRLVVGRKYNAFPLREALIYLVDVDTLQQRGVPGTAPAATHGVINLGRFTWDVLEVDTRDHRAFLADANEATGPFDCPLDGSSDDIACRTAPRRIKTASLVGKFAPTVFTFPPQFAGQGVKALTYDTDKKVLYAVTYIKPLVPLLPGLPVVHHMWVHAIDGEKLVSNPADALLWSYPVDSCGELPGERGQQPYLGVGLSNDFVYLGCRGLGAETPGFPDLAPQATMNGVTVINFNSSSPGQQNPAMFQLEFYPFAGQLDRGMTFGSRTQELLVIVAKATGVQRLYVFDAGHRAWTGSVPLGDGNIKGGAADPATGRLYVLDQERGFAVSDGGQLPVVLGGVVPAPHRILSRQHPAFDPVTRRIFIAGPSWGAGAGQLTFNHLRIHEDRTDPFVEPTSENPDDQTRDMEESLAASVTRTGSGSAWGLRLSLAGGVRGTPASHADVFTGLMEGGGAPIPPQFKTQPGDRGGFVARVPKAELTNTLVAGQAVGSAFDEGTESELKSKFSQAAVDDFKANVPPFQESRCEDPGEIREDTHQGSRVTCVLSEARVEAAAAAPGEFEGLPIRVGPSSSRVSVRRDPDRGVVTTAEAVVSDVYAVGGAIQIGKIRSVAETAAKGRPNTAASTFRVLLERVRIADPNGGPSFECGFFGAGDKDANQPCDAADVSQAINLLLPTRVQAQAPRPATDPVVRGSPKGAQAIVYEDDYPYWSDFNVNFDTFRELPGLTLTFFMDGREGSRLIAQLAAVRAESHYEIGDVRPPVVSLPAALALELSDQAGAPLAGGLFALHEEGAGGAAGSPVGECTTASDGVGNCRFAGLPEGSYLVRQVASPPGYAPADDFSVELAGGFETVLQFVNLETTGGVAVRLTDDGSEPQPLAGGVFALYGDPDGDGLVGSGDQVLGSCETNAEGTCGFEKVPLAHYVVRETRAPSGYEATDDVAFELAQPGQVAELEVVNGLASATAIVRAASIRPPAPVASTRPLNPRSGIFDIPRYLRDVARFLFHRPWQAVLFALIWLLLGAPGWLAKRRAALMVARETRY